MMGAMATPLEDTAVNHLDKIRTLFVLWSPGLVALAFTTSDVFALIDPVYSCIVQIMRCRCNQNPPPDAKMTAFSRLIGYDMNKDLQQRWTNLSAALVCTSLVAFPDFARAETCPSIDAWLELIHERGGRHRLLDAVELSDFQDKLERGTVEQHRPWTSAIVTVFPDGKGLVLLNVNTEVCGVIEVPIDRRPSLQKPIVLHG
ncbi:hypothetical protein [Candidatus Phyllobacterium onerii]|uniref:hypothetical protein n=1 Tax=Candidatus Phyllobacterium onerii TaxID=3020828 RepID=UPI00232AFE16|nr:hypothetical protein [Phyllobacterium sp. IY22]